jgi:Alginate lyase
MHCPSGALQWASEPNSEFGGATEQEPNPQTRPETCNTPHVSGPYIRRDGLSNPNRFDDHRQALIRMSQIVPALTAGWMASGDKRFAQAAKTHPMAWFVNPETRMTPHLEHAQAIIGVNTGRGAGIIDTLHFAEVALAMGKLFILRNLLNSSEEGQLRERFQDYLNWMRTSVNCLDEADEVNNDGICCVLQISAFAKLLSANNQYKSLKDMVSPAGFEPATY